MAHVVVDEKDMLNNGVPNIFQLLNQAKQKVGAVGKTERNSSQGFNFRGIDTVVNAVGPIFNELGIINAPKVIEQIYETVEIGQKRTPMGHMTLVVEYTFYGPDGSSVAATVVSEAMDSGDKAAAKAMSVAWRIALLQVLNLPTDEPDPDSQSYERAGGADPKVTTTGNGSRTSSSTSVATVAPSELLEDILNAATVDDIRAQWKIAGATGHLPSLVTIGDLTTTVQELLYRRKDELGKA
jgi:hypothetical protein